MRIFYAADKTLCSGIESYLLRNNLYLSLVDMGHDVIEFEYDLTETYKNLDPKAPMQKIFIDKNRPVVSEELLRQIKEAHDEEPVDLFFSYFYSACILPSAIEEIKSMGIKTINKCCNSPHQLDLISEISPHYDWCLVPEGSRLKDYVTMDVNPIYCQEAANPRIYRHYDLPYEYDVTFIGRAYGERPAYIKYLLDYGLDIKVWGANWEEFLSEDNKNNSPYDTRGLNDNLFISEYLTKHVKLPQYMIGKPLSDLELVKTYGHSKINLGFSSCDETYKTDNKILQIRPRDFEVPMSGGFYMVEYIEELEEFYDIGKEIVCYTGPDDLVSKIKYYLRNDSEREAIRQAGYERCQRDHTWQKRFQMVFDQMSIE